MTVFRRLRSHHLLRTGCFCREAVALLLRRLVAAPPVLLLVLSVARRPVQSVALAVRHVPVLVDVRLVILRPRCAEEVVPARVAVRPDARF